ncbi:glycosyltransferase [bacterium]|nr:glycosyltransferase [bacterium]
MGDIKISVCMIVRDEEDVLQRAINSVFLFCDELVIVDTGSTDKTIQLIKDIEGAHPVQVVFGQIEWEGDFSKARNYSMDLATGNRVFIIDADEYIVEGGWDHIREAAEDPNFACGTMQVVNSTRQGAVRGESVIQPRMFRNEEDGSSKMMRYKNKVHNQIDQGILEFGKHYLKTTGNKPAMVGINAKMMHTGYDLSAEESVSKYTPRLSILRDEISRARSNNDLRGVAYYEYQLALMLHMVYNMEDALPIWETLDYASLNIFNRWHSHYIAARAFLKVDRLDKARFHCSGMFEVMDHKDATIEPVSWIITGAVLCDYGVLNEDQDTYKQGVILMIEGYFKNLNPEYGIRCIADLTHLQRDISHYASRIDKEASLMLSSTNASADIIEIMKDLQSSLVHFDESLLELAKGE